MAAFLETVISRTFTKEWAYKPLAASIHLKKVHEKSFESSCIFHEIELLGIHGKMGCNKKEGWKDIMAM